LNNNLWLWFVYRFSGLWNWIDLAVMKGYGNVG
jgi:hypothetical protein